MPPGLDGDATPTEQVAATAACIRNLFRAHAAAREEIRRLHPEAKVGANPCVLGLPEWFQRWADRQLTSLRDQEEWVRCEELSRDGRPLTRKKGGPLTRLKQAFEEFRCKVRSFATLSNTNWWYLGMAGRLPAFLCPPECVGTQDYVALDYYWGISTLRIPRLVRLIEAMQQKFARAPVWPGGLYQAIRHHARLFPGMEILITENGCPDTADGYSRVKYLVSHVKEVVRARRRGMPVVGYLYWSITTCREWGLECGPASDFGLFHIELDGDPELKRVPTAAAETYRALIARYGGPPGVRVAPTPPERRPRAPLPLQGQ
jgi:hypothetical protein